MKVNRSWRRIAYRIVVVVLLIIVGLGGTLINNMTSRSDLIPVGSPAPEFTTTASDGTKVSLAQLRGKKIILVFYPGDNTSICTAQLCALRDNWPALQAANAVVLGVNPAGIEKHADFAAKNHFPFPLLSDDRGAIMRSYGCRAIFGIVKRTVYVIDEGGKVIWANRGNPDPSEILASLHGT